MSNIIEISEERRSWLNSGSSCLRTRYGIKSKRSSVIIISKEMSVSLVLGEVDTSASSLRTRRWLWCRFHHLEWDMDFVVSSYKKIDYFHGRTCRQMEIEEQSARRFGYRARRVRIHISGMIKYENVFDPSSGRLYIYRIITPGSMIVLPFVPYGKSSCGDGGESCFSSILFRTFIIAF